MSNHDSPSRAQTIPSVGRRRSSVPRRHTTLTHIRKFSEDYGLYKDLGLYQDALKKIKPLIIANNGYLNAEDRNMLASAYKHILNGLRSHLNPEPTGQTGDKSAATAVEISRVCNEVIDLLQQCLIPAASAGEESVFYWKMFADFHRYLCETPSEESSQDHANASFQAYKFAFLHARRYLNPTNQTCLGVALNFSVFYHDVFKNPDYACYVAKFAFDEAVAYAGDHPGEVSDESCGVMKILQDNLTCWLGEITWDGTQPGRNIGIR